MKGAYEQKHKQCCSRPESFRDRFGKTAASDGGSYISYLKMLEILLTSSD
jgi:hypothetical protein